MVAKLANVMMPAVRRPLPNTADILESFPRWRALSAAEAERSPHRAIASLRLHIEGSAGTVVHFAGTGWFISPTRVVTAAHVTDVHHAWNDVRGAHSWYLEVVPALSPHRRPLNQAWATRVHRHPNWNGVDVGPFDIAVLEVSSELEPQFSLDLQSFAAAGTAGSSITLSGYPFAGFNGDTQVLGDGPIGVIEGSMLFYDIDTEGGQSGSPIFMSDSGARLAVVGMHLSGQGVGASPLARSLNAGLALRPDLIDWLRTVGQ